MPYDPVINTLGPQLIEAGYSGAARMNMLGAQEVSDNIGSAASAMAGGIGKSMLTQQEIHTLGGKVQAMHDAGLLSDEDVAKFNSGSLAAKRGMVGEWDAKQNILNQKDLDTFRTNDAIRRNSAMLGQEGANAATVAQLKAGATPPKYSKVTLNDGTVAFVAPNAPTKYPAGNNGQPLKAAVQQNPLAALINGGSTPGQAAPVAPAPTPAPAADPQNGGGSPPAQRQAMGGYQVGRSYSGMRYLGGDPNDPNSWQQ